MEINQFLEKVKNEVTPLHLINYKKELTRFSKAIGGKPLKRVNAKDIENYKNQLFEKKHKPSGIRTRLGILRVFEKKMGYKWGYNWKENLPRSGSPRDTILSREVLTNEEIQKLIDNAGHLKYKAIIALLANTGARINEVLALKMKDIYIDPNGDVIVKFNQPNTRTKDHTKEAILTFAREYIKVYLESIPYNSDAPLFDVKDITVRQRLAKIAKECGINKKVTPHSLRHWRATQLARMQLSAPVVCKALGWRGVAMWSVYSHIRNEEAARAIAEVERNGKPKIEATPLELKTNLERKALEALEEKQRLEQRIAELESKLALFTPQVREAFLAIARAFGGVK